MEEREEKNKSRTTFTFYSAQLNKITNSVKRTNLGIAFRNTNTLQVPRHKRIYEETEQDESESKIILATYLIDHTSE
jgi:hypothetical protein